MRRASAGFVSSLSPFGRFAGRESVSIDLCLSPCEIMTCCCRDTGVEPDYLAPDAATPQSIEVLFWLACIICVSLALTCA